jgi:IclR family acetate operon transcriptional repressor
MGRLFSSLDDEATPTIGRVVIRINVVSPHETVIGTLERGIDVLELLGERGEMRLAEVAKELTTSRATAFRMLATLQSRGYVEHVRAAHVYRLGPALQSLASSSAASSVPRCAAPGMAALRTETGETVNLGVIRRGRIVYASILDGVHALRVNAEVGDEVPAHATAIGKSILAVLPYEQRGFFLDPEPYPSFTERTITRRAALEKELQATAKRGFGVDDQETGIGAVCVAAPIVGVDKYPVAAISVSAIAARLPRKSFPALGQTIKQWADWISDELATTASDRAAVTQ